MNVDLNQVLSGHVFAFMIVFTRLSAGFIMFPGIGEAFVMPRVRMMFSLAMTFLLLPVLMPLVPPQPTDIAGLIKLIAIEALVGLFFGSIMRLLMDIVETTGSVIALEMGLSNAMVLNPSMAGQSALSSAFLGVAAISMLFVTGLDHFLLKALVGTYQIFPVGAALPFGDMVQSFVNTMVRSFAVGVQLSAPFIVMGLLFHAVLGVMQRLMPQIQLFITVLPIQICGGILLFAITVSGMMVVWLQVFDDVTASLFVR